MVYKKKSIYIWERFENNIYVEAHTRINYFNETIREKWGPLKKLPIRREIFEKYSLVGLIGENIFMRIAFEKIIISVGKIMKQ